MRQVRTVPLSMIAVMAVAIVTVAVEVPHLGARIAAAAPASFVTAFRDLPASVLTGEILIVQVDAPGGTTCEGLVVYRDNSEQELEEVNERDERCRWDVVVPETTRRGEADIFVTVHDGDESTTLSAIVNVVRRAEDVGLVLKNIPGEVRRNNEFSIRLDVPDKATCHGLILYKDGTSQALDPQIENKERCRWDPTVPAEVARGTALVTMVVTHADRQTTLRTSFDVSGDNDDADVLAAFQDLPPFVRRDNTLPIRVLVPGGATCTGEVSFRSADNVKLDETYEQSGLCRWSIVVPSEAKRGDTEIDVTVKANGDESSIRTTFVVDETSSDVDAAFKDLASSIQRGAELEVRVTVPDNASCQGEVTFDDGAVKALDPQVETRDRCLWSIKVPNRTSRGPAIVRVLVNDHGLQTTLIGNVTVEAGEDDPVTPTWASLPKEFTPGETLEVVVSVAGGSTCAGRIDFAEGMRWMLGTTNENDMYCRWNVHVPTHVNPGEVAVEIKIERRGETSTLTGNAQVRRS